MSRRSLLKTAALAGASASGVASLTACDAGLGSSGITLSVASSDAHIRAMPSNEEREQSPSDEAYAQALESWMAENPDVTLDAINIDIYDQEAMTTALAGGTAPAAFLGNVIGGWNNEGIRSAFMQGLAADVTELIEQTGLVDQLIEPAQPIWRQTWRLDGRYYAIPRTYNVGVGLHYRRDLLDELGVAEPEPGWTWQDLRELARALTDGDRKGIALQTWPMDNALTAEGFDLLTQIPAPDTGWNWRWDYSIAADAWIRAIENVRAMRFEDESTLSDISFEDGDILNGFMRGDACMHINSVVYFSANPDSDESSAALADRLDRPIEEVVGWVAMPFGMNGYGPPGMTQGQIDTTSFDPDLSDDELAAAFDLQRFMIEEGFVTEKNVVYEQTEDLRRVYDSANIMPVLQGVLEELPGTPEAAWGERFMEAMREASSIPLRPTEAWHIPPEMDAGPSEDALDDARTRWWYEGEDVDIRTDLERLGQVRNEQADGFTSSVDEEEFVEAARTYYDAQAEFLSQHASEFYEQVYQPWYDEHVRPVLD